MAKKIARTIRMGAFCWLLSISVSYAQQALVVRGGTLIDGNGGAPLENVDILIEGDRISEIRIGGFSRVPPNAEILDARGKFILPGLQDFHLHYRGWMPPLFINHGITTIHDIGNSPPQWILAQRELLQQERIVGPRLYAAVLNLYGRPRRDVAIESRLPDMIFFETVAEARSWAEKAVELKADYIKVHDGFTGEMLLAVVQVAKANNLPVVGHVSPVLDAFQAAELGQNEFEHSTGVGRAITLDLDELRSLRKEWEEALIGRARTVFEALAVDFYSVDPVKEERLIHVLVEKDIFLEADWVTPSRNITPRKKEWAFQDLVFFSNPELSFVPLGDRLRWLDYSPWEHFSEDLKAKLIRSLANWKNFIVKFSAAGGKVIVGTASPNAIPGISVHRDMQLMVDAGLPPMKALQAATRNIAELAGLLDDLGTIEAGKYADLLIIDGNPLEDISNTQKIAHVIKGGKKIDRRYSADFRNPIPTPVMVDEGGHNNPKPAITGMDPVVFTQGDPETVAEIRGRGFTIGSVAYVNHHAVRTKFKSPELLEVVLSSTLLSQVGTYPVQVINPHPLPPLENAGDSNKLMVIVKFR